MTHWLVVAVLLLAAPAAWAADTGAKLPLAAAAVGASAGDNDGFDAFTVSVVASVALSDNVYAIDNDSGSGVATDGCATFPQAEDDQHDFATFAFGIPGGATIDGIEVVIEASVTTATGGTDIICVNISPDGGATWATAKATADLTSTDATFTLGGAADTWGRAWTDTEFSDVNFLLRLMPDASGSGLLDFQVDVLSTKVYYTAAAGGCTPRRTLLGVGC